MTQGRPLLPQLRPVILQKKKKTKPPIMSPEVTTRGRCVPLPSLRVFSNESALRIRWPKYWSLSFSISPSNLYSGLISIRIDWFDLLAVQGTLKSLLQHHSSESISSSVLSLQYGPTLTSLHDYWKKHSFTIQTFVNKVTSLLFNMLSRFVMYGDHLI